MLSENQWLALGIFILSYGLIISNKVHRTIAALLGALLVGMLVLPMEELLKAENWETLGFIFGMMIVIAAMEESGFFRWLGLHSAKIVRLDPLKLFILFPFITALLSAFVSSITVMIFMATLTLEVCSILKMRPLPLILSEICASNIGGVSTMVGDPPNVILGTYFHLSFLDFVINTGPVGVVAFVVNTGIFIFFFRKLIFSVRADISKNPDILDKVNRMHPREAIKDRWLFYLGIFAFIYIIVLLVTNYKTGLGVAFIALTSAAIVLFLGGPNKRMPVILERVDWVTLLFFACLFLIVGGMEYTGLLRIAAVYIGNVSGGNFFVALTIILWFCAIGSAFIDNVPFAATLAPIIKYLSASFHFPLTPLVWSTAIGTDIGGNGTPIGASANVVAIAIFEKARGETVTWAEYCKYCFSSMVLVILLCNILIYLLYIM
jgi:Na+/H+ antiporter NhaD/arsenite permease-like protein